MTRSTYTKREAVFHAVYIIFLSVCGLLGVVSTVYSLENICCNDDKVAVCFSLFFTLLIISVDFFECRAMGAKLYMNDDGIGVRRFGKTKVFIKWNDIKEIGTGSIPTPFGSKKRVYFSNRELSEDEKNDLIILKYHTVHFSYIPKEWYEEMKGKLPVSMSKEVEDRYVR